MPRDLRDEVLGEDPEESAEDVLPRAPHVRARGVSCLERLEQYIGARSSDELMASAEPWSRVASVMVRDAEIAHLQATVEWLRRIRQAMKWMQDRSGALQTTRS